MKKLLLLPLILLALAAPASAQTAHIKVEICHWANGHPHSIEVSEHAADAPFTTNHGEVTVGYGFTPHPTPGHAEDFLVRVFSKAGNTETNIYVNERKCEIPAPTTTTTTAPTTTTTVSDPVTTTTVTATPTAPPTVQPPVASPGPVASPRRGVPVQTDTLPRTGGVPLLGIGSGVAALGLILRRFFK